MDFCVGRPGLIKGSRLSNERIDANFPKRPPPGFGLTLRTGPGELNKDIRLSSGLCKAERMSGLSSPWGSQDSGDTADSDSWPEGLDPFTSTPMDVVLAYYDAINNRRLDDAAALYSSNAMHHNLAFSQAAVGKQACADFVSDFCNNVPADLRFVIDDISAARSVGVIWHMEVGGMELPLGKGMSFYQVDARGKISYVRECPEHFAKVASASPLLLRLSAPFIRDMSALPGGITDAIGEELQRAASTVMGSVPSLPPVELPPSIRNLPEIISGSISGSMSGSMDSWQPPAGSPTEFREAVGADMPERSQDEGADPSRDAVVDSLVGTWRRKARLTDDSSYNKAMSIMGMGGIVQQVAEVIDGRILSHEVGYGQGVRVRFLASVPGFPELYEDYKFSEWTEMDRRDQQPGQQRCRAFVGPEDGKLRLTVELGPSKSWNATDTYELLSSNELHVHSEVTNPEGERSTVTMSYSREN